MTLYQRRLYVIMNFRLGHFRVEGHHERSTHRNGEADLIQTDDINQPRKQWHMAHLRHGNELLHRFAEWRRVCDSALWRFTAQISKMLALEMSINDLAEFLFIKHNGESPISIDLCGGIADVRDLYCFLIDLLCKGLVLSSGCDRVDLDSVSQEVLAKVIGRMRCIGIDVHVSIDAYEGNSAHRASKIDLGELYTSGAIASDIKAYELTIVTPSKRIRVHFSFATL